MVLSNSPVRNLVVVLVALVFVGCGLPSDMIGSVDDPTGGGDDIFGGSSSSGGGTGSGLGATARYTSPAGRFLHCF